MASFSTLPDELVLRVLDEFAALACLDSVPGSWEPCQWKLLPLLTVNTAATLLHRTKYSVSFNSCAFSTDWLAVRGMSTVVLG